MSVPTPNPLPGQGVTPPTGTPVTGNSSGGVTPPAAPATLEDALKLIEELRHTVGNKTEESDRHAKRLKTFEQQEEAAKLAAMTEVERVKKEAGAAAEKVKGYQRQLAAAHVQIAAQAMGIINPSLVADAIQGKLEYDEETGLPKNLDKVLADLIKANPYLVKLADTTPPQGTNPGHSAPAIPPMSPGRSSIPSPQISAQPGKPPRLSQIKWNS